MHSIYNKICLLLITCLLQVCLLHAQSELILPIDANWKLRNVNQTSWMDVPVPGCVQTELIKRKIIPSPLWGNNEKLCNWVENESWEYACYFDVSPSVLSQKKILLILEGIDTYAKIKLNGFALGEVQNMHITNSYDVTKIVRGTGNLLSVELSGVQKHADKLSAAYPITLPTDNRVFIRKAAYQFGWDFAPRFLSMGIYKSVFIKAGNTDITAYPKYSYLTPIATLDTALFQFSQNGKPIYIKGANYVPPSIYPNISNRYYDSLIAACKLANINMLRVWGGGFYPSEYFYELCDANKIMVWQDFMFANALLPSDANFTNNLKAEVADAIRKLRHHTCIVLWCGNNEIDEAWQNWGWQKNYTDPQKEQIWQAYNQFFKQDVPALVKLWDDARPYISTSPKYGWGKPESMQSGDAHYWGVWWGKEPITNYYYKVPRMMSEFGLQSMPDIHTVLQYCEPNQIKELDTNFANHQKCNDGFEKLNYYLQNYPTPKDSLGKIYYSQILQRDAMQVGISAQRSAFPFCNGSLPWQLNDTWPGISWSMIDYYNRPKASFYNLKKLYAKNAIVLGKKVFKNGMNILDTSKQVFALSICEPTFSVYDFYGQLIYQTTAIDWQVGDGGNFFTTSFFDKFTFNSFAWGYHYLVVDIKNKDGLSIQQPYFFAEPNKIKVQPTSYTVSWKNENTATITSTMFAKDVYLYCKNANVTFSENYFDLLPNQAKTITVYNAEKGKDDIQVFSSIDMTND
jgi:beta-mannosidase